MARKLSLALGLFVLAGAAYVLYLRSSGTKPAALADKGLHITGSNAGYVASETCADCHQGIWNTYKKTGMGRSFARVDAAAPIEDYQHNNTYFHKASDRYYTMVRRDGKLYQRRHQAGFDGKETNVVEKEVQFVLGSGNHSRTYLQLRPDGRLIELPVGWYAEKGGYWAMNPGYDRPDQEDFRRQITYQCMFCHNGYPTVEDGADLGGTAPVFKGVLPNGIDCQRCHGPGRAHVQAMQSGKAVEGTIVNPARLERERQLELCMQCHLETTSFRLPSAIVRYQRGIFSYRPGEPLVDYSLHFDKAFPSSGASQNKDGFEIAHAAYRLRQSQCFLKSNPQMVCTTCHNPHDIPRGEQAAQHYTAVCERCHSTNLQKLVASNRHTASKDCVGCHMPKRRTDDVVHVVMTDHYIQRRKPARDLLAPLAETVETDDSSYRGPVDLYYPQSVADAAQQELYLAVAQVRQGANLKDGVPRLESVIQKYKPSEAEFYFELAQAYSKQNQADKAIDAFKQAVDRKPDYWPAVRGLGAALARTSRFQEANDTLQKALAVMPDDASLLNDLGLVNIGLGKTSEAVELLKKASRSDSDYPDPYNNLGSALLRQGDRAGAEAAYRSAIQVQPDFAEAHRNLASLLASGDRLQEAEYHFRKAIESNPKDGGSHFEYGIALARNEKFPQAKAQFEAAGKADPNLAEAHNALGEMWSIEGNAARATEAYRRAVAAKPELAPAQSNLGVALLLQGQVAEAKQHLEKAVALNPDLFEAHLYLGRILSQQRDTQSAAGHYRKAGASPDPETRRAATEALQNLGLQ